MMAGEGSRGCTKTVQLMQIHIWQDRLPGQTSWDDCRTHDSFCPLPPWQAFDPLQKVCVNGCR